MLQPGEIIIIALLALIVLGPRRLPEMARKLGQWTNELRNAAREISRGLESEVAELKAVGDELKGSVEELKKPLSDLNAELKAADPRGVGWTGPKPISGPTPEDAMADLKRIEAAARGGEAEEPAEADGGAEVDEADE